MHVKENLRCDLQTKQNTVISFQFRRNPLCQPYQKSFWLNFLPFYRNVQTRGYLKKYVMPRLDFNNSRSVCGTKVRCRVGYSKNLEKVKLIYISGPEKLLCKWTKLRPLPQISIRKLRTRQQQRKTGKNENQKV